MVIHTKQQGEEAVFSVTLMTQEILVATVKVMLFNVCEQ